MGVTSGPPRIFCVDGDPDFLNLIQEILSEERHAVTTSIHGQRTFQEIATLLPDLVIVDLVLDRRVGRELLERLRRDAATRDIPVLVTSTDSRILCEVRADPARYGGNDFLAKPFDVATLVETVRRLLATRGQGEGERTSA
jgi:CheY-like chemotaxis protein